MINEIPQGWQIQSHRKMTDFLFIMFYIQIKLKSRSAQLLQAIGNGIHKNGAIKDNKAMKCK